MEVVSLVNYPPQGADATGHPQYHAPPPAPPSLPPQLVMQHQAPHISPESVGEAPPSAPPPPAAPTVAWNISPETAADESRGVVVAPASNSSGLHGSPVAPPPTENTGGATAFPQDDEVTADPVIPPSEVIDSSSSEDAGAAASSTPTVSEDARTVTDVPVSTRTTAENPGAVGGSASTSRDEESARRLEAAEFLRKAFLSALCAMEKLFPSPVSFAAILLIWLDGWRRVVSMFPAGFVDSGRGRYLLVLFAEFTGIWLCWSPSWLHDIPDSASQIPVRLGTSTATPHPHAIRSSRPSRISFECAIPEVPNGQLLLWRSL